MLRGKVPQWSPPIWRRASITLTYSVVVVVVVVVEVVFKMMPKMGEFTFIYTPYRSIYLSASFHFAQPMRR